MTGCRAALSAFAEATADRRSLGGGWSGPPLAGSAAQSDALKASRTNKSPGQRPGPEPKGGTAPSYTSGMSLPNYYRAAPLAPHRAGVRGGDPATAPQRGCRVGDPALSRPENRGRRLVVTSTPSADTVH